MERYEITVEVDDDVVMSDEVIGQEPSSRSSPVAVGQLKSEVMRRRGRGFEQGRAHDSFILNDHSYSPAAATPTSSLPSGEALAERSVEGWTVFITNINEEATEDDLVDLLADYGKAKEVRMVLDHRTGFAKGYAITEFREYREAKRVIEGLDGRLFLGQSLRADFAFIRSVNFGQ
jgi:RNA-binding protein 8A